MGRYLYDTEDLNNPTMLLETASLILTDLVGSLATIAELFNSVQELGEGEATQLNNGTMTGLLRMLQGGAQLAYDKVDHSLDLIMKQRAGVA